MFSMKDPFCKSFAFSINNTMFFSKGSNIVPMDSLKDRISFEKFKWLTDMAIASNQNVLRIWGGG